ncbi:MAG: AMP-binding protein [Actinomycetales bacterium]
MIPTTAGIAVEFRDVPPRVLGISGQMPSDGGSSRAGLRARPVLLPTTRGTHVAKTPHRTTSNHQSSDNGSSDHQSSDHGSGPRLPADEDLALVDEYGRGLAHGELRALVVEAARHLPPPSRRALVHLPMTATLESVVRYLAVVESGHVALVTSPDRDRNSHILRRYQPAPWPAVAQHGPALHPDLAVLLSTSGSTGSPKLVRLSADNLTSNADAIAASLALTRGDLGVTSLPLHYCYGLSVLHAHLRAGAGVVLTGESVLDERFWQRVGQHGVSTLAAVPHTMDLIEQSGRRLDDLTRLRLVTVAGGRLAPATAVRWARRGERSGWQLALMYGQTEATARISILDPAQTADHPDSVGRPVPGTQVTLDLGAPAADPARGVGELVVTGCGVMLGYAEHPDELALGRTTTRLPTGDLARLDDEGRIHIVGRARNLSKIMGLRVDLNAVEAALTAAGLTACALPCDDELRILVDDPLGNLARAGDDPAAGWQVGGGADHVGNSAHRFPDAVCPGAHPGQAKGGCAGRTPAVMIQARATAARAAGLPPAAVRVLVTPLPRLDNGKIDRSGCAARVADSPAPAGQAVVAAPELRPPGNGAAIREAGVGAVAQIVASALGVEAPGVDTELSFVDLGGDSLSYVQVCVPLTTLVGPLPRGWHQRPLADLVPPHRPGRSTVSSAPGALEPTDLPGEASTRGNALDGSPPSGKSPGSSGGSATPDDSAAPAGLSKPDWESAPGRATALSSASADKPIARSPLEAPWDLEATGNPTSGASAAWQSCTTDVETPILLRAIAAVMICGTHAGLFWLPGGAHTLLAVAGFSAAMFVLSAPEAGGRWRAGLRTAVGIAVPTAVVAAIGLAYGRYGWSNVVLSTWLIGDVSYGRHNELWFVDALLSCLLLTLAWLAVPAVARRWLVDPWRPAMAWTVLALAPRFVVLDLADGTVRGMLPTVLWLFALGLTIAHANTPTRRALTLAVAALGCYGFFPDDPMRNATIFTGLVVLTLVPRIRVPRPVIPLVATIASASLYIYLVQFHVLDLARVWTAGPLAATVAAVVAGVVTWRLADRPVRRLQYRLVPARGPRVARITADPPRTQSRSGSARI